MSKIIWKTILYVLVLITVIGIIYIYKLHSLAVEGNKIFEKRCLEVNPFLIAYKNSFLSFADAIKNPDKFTPEQGKGFYEDYIQGMRDYVPKENNWIVTQRNFINRWDFKLIEPWYVKEAGEYQIKMYEGYRDEAQASVDVVDGKITVAEYEAVFADSRKRRNLYTDLYNEIFDKAIPIQDWRKFFGSVPVPSGCNDSNLIIPDTTGALDPDPIPAEKSEITG